MVKDFRERFGEWARAARDSGANSDVVRAFSDAVNKVAVEEIDKLIRAKIADKQAKVPVFAELPEQDYYLIVENWLAAVKAPVRLVPQPSEQQMTSVVTAVNNLRKPMSAVAQNDKK